MALRPRSTVPAAALLAALGSVPVALPAQQSPEGWQWVPDAPATLVTSQEVPDGSFRFVEMAPGWHITSGPGVVLYHPRHNIDGIAATGSFVVRSEIFLFPDSRDGEYGVFLAGKNLSTDAREYLAFLLRRDGSAAVLHRVGGETHEVWPWTAADSAARLEAGNGPAKNVLTVDVTPTQVSFLVNGGLVATLPRSMATVEGTIGFRAGPKVNLHASTLDLTFRLAPARQP